MRRQRILPVGATESQAGFTLISTLVAASIGLVLAVMAFEAGSEMLRTAKTSAAGGEIASALLQARQAAMTNHTVFFLSFTKGGTDRVRSARIIRDDGSGVFEPENDQVLEFLNFDQDIRIGDGTGGLTSLPERDADGTTYWEIGFGRRGEARDPLTGAPLTAFLNVSAGGPKRGDWRKFSNIQIAPSGSVDYSFHSYP
jgi:Tfp pilus assembly protein FimT